MKHLRLILGLTGWIVCSIVCTTTRVNAQPASVTTTEPTMTTATSNTSSVTAYENFQAGNLTRAVQQWTQAIREDEDVVHSLFNRSQAFIMLEQYDFALRDINQIIDIEGPQAGPDVFLIQGIILGNLNRLPEALVSFEQSENQRPSALVHSNRALVHQRAGDFQAALSDLNRAIELAPTPVNYLNLANLYIQLEEFDTAIEQIDQLFAINTTFFPAYLARGIAFYHLGEHELALQDFLSTLTAAPQQPEARYYAGLSLAALGMREDASQNLLVAADLYLQQNQGDSYYQVLDMMSQLGL